MCVGPLFVLVLVVRLMLLFGVGVGYVCACMEPKGVACLDGVVLSFESSF